MPQSSEAKIQPCNCPDCQDIIHQVAHEDREREERRTKEEMLFTLRSDSSVEGHIKRKRLIEELYGVTVQ